MNYHLKPTMGTLREWNKAYDGVKNSRGNLGRLGLTSTINSLVPGTSTSTAAK